MCLHPRTYLGEALRRLARYSSIVNEGIKLTFRGGKSIGLTFEYVGVPRHSDQHQVEFWIAALVRACRQITNRNLAAQRVSFAHRRVPVSEMNSFFGCEVSFSADGDEVSFPGTFEDVPIMNADPHLNGILIKFCEEALAHRKIHRSSFGLRVENEIALLLPHGKAQAGEVARKLNLSKRTPIGRRRTDICQSAPTAAIKTPRQTPPFGSRSVNFEDRVAARLPECRRVLKCLQTLDGQSARNMRRKID